MVSEVIRQIQEAEHSPVGGSSAKRIIACSGSLALSLGRDDPTSEWAAEGTAAHGVLEDCLNQDADAVEFMSEERSADGFTFKVTKEMVDAVQVLLNQVRADVNLLKRHKAKLKKFMIEDGVDMSDVVPGLRGTVDVGLVWDRAVDLYDFKYGAGVPVEVKENDQLMYYGFLILMSLTQKQRDKIQAVRLHVAQPRHEHPDGPVRVWNALAKDILDWAHVTLIPAIERAIEIAEDYHRDKGLDTELDLLAEGHLNDGDHCQFCPARTVCPLLIGKFGDVAEAAESGFKPVVATDAELVALKDKFDSVKKIMTAVDQEMFARMMKGAILPGYKLVAKKSDRVWRDGALEVIQETYGDDAYEVKPLSPARVEKLAGGKKLAAEWAYKPETGLTLAPESDKRVAVRRSAAEAFSDVGE